MAADQIPPEEEYERIPWERLTSPAGDKRGIIYAVAAAVVAAGISAALARNFSDRPQPPPSSVAVEVATTTVPVPKVAETFPQEETFPPSTAWSEADLLALDPALLREEAATMAEWFVADFFTLDGSDQIGLDLAGMIPDPAPRPDQGQEHRSFVEWARAISASEGGSGEYRVLVVVRSLGAAPGENYQRLPLRAVEVSLRWTEEGWSILDLPTPADVPEFASVPPWPEEVLPEEVADQARSRAGPEGTVLGGGRVGERWRVMIEQVDSAGGRWPLVIWIDPGPG
jgi:hypothetical protein